MYLPVTSGLQVDVDQPRHVQLSDRRSSSPVSRKRWGDGWERKKLIYIQFIQNEYIKGDTYRNGMIFTVAVMHRGLPEMFFYQRPSE